MSKPVFVTTMENINVNTIKFGKIETKDSIPNSKFSRAAIGLDGMPESHLTCIPRSGNYRDKNTCLHIIFKEKMQTTGLVPQYVFIPGKKVDRTPENITGYSLNVPLVHKDRINNPNELEATNINGFKALYKAAIKFVLANKKSLPVAFKGLSDDELKACVMPIETPPKAPYGPSLFGKIGYFKAKSAEFKDNKEISKAKPENFTTIFKQPGGKIPDPKTLVKAYGTCTFVLRINHLNFVTGDQAKDMKIKFDTEITEVNFTKSVRQESNLLGDNTDQEEEAPTNSSQAFGIDATDNYSAPAPASYGDDDESDSSQEAPPPKKKKAVVEEDEPVQKKKKAPVVEEDEPAPVQKKKKTPVVEETDEEPVVPKKKKKVVEED